MMFESPIHLENDSNRIKSRAVLKYLLLHSIADWHSPVSVYSNLYSTSTEGIEIFSWSAPCTMRPYHVVTTDNSKMTNRPKTVFNSVLANCTGRQTYRNHYGITSLDAQTRNPTKRKTQLYRSSSECRRTNRIPDCASFDGAKHQIYPV